MAGSREIKIEEQLKNLAADFLQRESNGQSLITVTRAELGDKMKEATIFFTVFPDDKQEDALEFTKRKRSEFKQYVKEHSKIGRLPFFDFAVDFGEKNRQRIDELSLGN